MFDQAGWHTQAQMSLWVHRVLQVACGAPTQIWVVSGSMDVVTDRKDDGHDSSKRA